MRLNWSAFVLTAMLDHAATAIYLDVDAASSISNASGTLAFGLMSWYQNNASGTAATAIGTFPAPLYWWEAGAVWGAMIDYWAYTNDTSYNPTVTQALLAQVGPDNNYMPPAYYSSLGNDDQAFWCFAVLNAVEYGYPTPSANSSTVWLDLAEAVFNTQWPRWDTQTCNGGLRWQIFESNAGYDYKNTISNGGFFQISARLARITGNQTYSEWAERAWDWMTAVGLIDHDYNVYDGTSTSVNCSQIDHSLWSYNPAVILYGAATMYNYTNGTELWANRTQGLLSNIENTYFSPLPNATNIMFQPSCEGQGNCDDDQLSFKAYLSRWMAKSAIVMPFITQSVTSYLKVSAQAAARSCSGGTTNETCGEKWYVGGYDGLYGVGQELSALETVQALLLLDGSATHIAPQHESEVNVATATITSTFTVVSTTAVHTMSTSSSTAASSSGAAPRGVSLNIASVNLREVTHIGCGLLLASLFGGVALLLWG